MPNHISIQRNQFLSAIKNFPHKQRPTARLFLFDCLFFANWEDREVVAENGLLKLKRGQMYFGLESMAKNLGCTVRHLRTVLSRFESDKIMTRETTNRGTILTVVNYDSYVYVKNENDNQNDKETTGIRQATDNSKELKELNTNNPRARACEETPCLPDETQQSEPPPHIALGWTHADDTPKGNGVAHGAASGARSSSTELVRLGNMPMAQEIFAKWREVSGRLEIFSHGQIASGDAAASLAELATLAAGEMGRDGVLQAIEVAYKLLAEAGDVPRTLCYVVQEIHRRNKAAAEGKERSEYVAQHRRTVALATAKFGIQNRAELEETYRAFREEGEKYPLRYLMDAHRGRWWNLPDDREDREEIEQMAKEAEQFVAKKRMA